MSTGRGRIFVYGKHAVEMLLSQRLKDVLHVYTSRSEKDPLLQKLPTKLWSHHNYKELTQLLKNNDKHQGYIALVCQRHAIELQDFIEQECITGKNLPRLLLLDQLTDPHNIGAILRTATAFDIHHVIRTKYHSPNEWLPTIAKTSAGMSELITSIEVVNLNNAIKNLQNNGYFVVGLCSKSSQRLMEIKDMKNICLVIGNEGNGLRHLVRKNCDYLCGIPLAEGVNSLNASVATALAIYELWGRHV
jgi:predicted rRNA methylase